MGGLKSMNLPTITSVDAGAAAAGVIATLGAAVFDNMKSIVFLNRSDEVLWLARTAALCVAGGASAWPLEPEAAGFGSGGQISMDIERVPSAGDIWVISSGGAAKRLGILVGQGL
jgi:hypothetical protein